MNLLTEKSANELPSLTNVPPSLVEARLQVGANQVYSSFQKKSDGSLVPFAVVPVTPEVAAFAKSDRKGELLVELVYNQKEQQHLIFAENAEVMKLAQHLWLVSLTK